MNDKLQEWFRVPVEVWESQKNLVWTKEAPAQEAWAIIDASWLDHHGNLPHKHRREDVRKMARRWGWTYKRAYNLLYDFLYSAHLRDRHENPQRTYRPIRSRVRS